MNQYDGVFSNVCVKGKVSMIERARKNPHGMAESFTLNNHVADTALSFSLVFFRFTKNANA